MNRLPTRRLLLVVAMVVQLAFAGGLLAGNAVAGEPLIVHEWGTFTTLQDEHGMEIAGVNIDDEPVPSFVHNLSRFVLAPALLTNEHWRFRMKAAPRRHPLVTMRLETPVIYFYPPKRAADQKPLELNVDVQFRGGWLTEFYPNAEAQAPGLGEGNFRFGYLSESTVGSLAWNNLQVGTKGKGPVTDEHVWTAPRQVRATSVTTPEGESEKYLFYRGVAHLHAPLQVRTHLDTDELTLHANFQDVLDSRQSASIRSAWVAEIREDGTAAYRRLPAMKVTASRREVVTTASASFQEDAFHRDNLESLKAEMYAALVAEGLYADEATAMLATWQRAYFQSPGRRVFFPVPRVWTDHYLPLTLSQPADLQRVMMARVELVTPRQRQMLGKLAKAEISDGSWLREVPSERRAEKERLVAGRADFGDLGVPVPADYQLYLQLGRFRNALIVAEEQRRPSPSLSRFIDVNGLHLYRW